MSLKGLPVVLAAIGLGCGGALGSDPGGTDIPADGGFDAVRDVGLDIRLIEVPGPTPAYCGNGVLDPGESCDDGNQRSGDGCTGLCQIECSFQCGSCGRLSNTCITSACGDGILSAAEVCDDGNATSDDGCAANCRAIESGWRCPIPGRRCVPICGDGVIEGPETCDDRNTVAGDGCSDVCLVEPSTAVCGNGVVEGAEECDDGIGASPGYARCGFDCRLGGYCGDGVVNGAEQCDLGDNNNSALYGNPIGCTSGCLLSRYCGDGIVDTDQGEQCDLGQNNGMAASACTADCRIILI